MGSEKSKIRVDQVGLDKFEIINEIQSNDGFEHSYPLSKERFTNLIHRGEYFFVSFYEGKAAGMISVDFEIRAKLHFFSVKKDYQGKGIGGVLLKKILEEAKNRNYSSVYVYVEIDSPVEKFLLNRGFEKVGYYRDRYKKANMQIFWRLVSELPYSPEGRENRARKK